MFTSLCDGLVCMCVFGYFIASSMASSKNMSVLLKKVNAFTSINVGHIVKNEKL